MSPRRFAIIEGVGRIDRVRAGFALGGLLATGLLGWWALAGRGPTAYLWGWVVPAAALIHMVQEAGCGFAWHALVRRPRLARSVFFWMRWIRSSVAALVPVSGVGAALVAVRLSVQRGIGFDLAAASLTVDATIEIVTQIIFTVIGLGLLVVESPAPHMMGWGAAGLATAVIGAAALIGIQRMGGFKLVELGLARIAARWPKLAPLAQARLHDRLLLLHRDRRAAFVAGLFHLGAWLLGAAEVWLILVAVGHPLSLANCVIVESLAMVARSAGFFVPGALGIQEGGLILAGSLVGLPAQTAIAIAIVKRLRDVAVGVPGLLAWQWAEDRRFQAAKPAAIASDERERAVVPREQ